MKRTLLGRSRPFPAEDEASRGALARRRRRRRARMGIAWGVVGMVALATGMGLHLGGSAGLDWIRTHTRLFEVRQVDVAETGWVSPWEVVELSGIVPGDDLLAIAPDTVAVRLCRHPRIIGAKVTRTWRRTVQLWIEESPPVALWMQGGTYEIAADGTVLGPPPATSKPEWPQIQSEGWRPRGVELPLLTGVHSSDVRPGMALSGKGAREALGFLARLRAYGSHGEGWISEVWVGESSGLVAVTLQGVVVRLGDGKLSRRKLEALQAVLLRIREEAGDVQYVDARFRNQVIVKTG